VKSNQNLPNESQIFDSNGYNQNLKEFPNNMPVSNNNLNVNTNPYVNNFGHIPIQNRNHSSFNINAGIGSHPTQSTNPPLNFQNNIPPNQPPAYNPSFNNPNQMNYGHNSNNFNLDSSNNLSQNNSYQ
jgi:hypothetical protein